MTTRCDSCGAPRRRIGPACEYCETLFATPPPVTYSRGGSIDAAVARQAMLAANSLDRPTGFWTAAMLAGAVGVLGFKRR